MGQTPTQLKQNQDYRLIEELPVGNIVKHNKTQALHFLKQYSFTAQEAYQNALNMHSLRLANKNQHILNFLHFTTKSQNSFCSSFHKIILIFEYSDYSLEKEINNRVRDGHPFTEKQVWSILCSCILAAVHLIHCEGKMHCGLTSKDIRLSANGCVKLLSHEMIGIDSHHNQNQGTPKSLAVTLLECINFEKVSNQDTVYLQKLVETLDCSRQMKEMLSEMIDKNASFLQLEQHLFKLVQDDESLASHSNTPILKSHSPLINSGYKCPRIVQNERSEPTTGKKQQKLLPLCSDSEDLKSFLFIMNETDVQIENPDETQEEPNQNQNFESDSPKEINSFYLKERKIQSNLQSVQTRMEIKDIEKVITKKDYEINQVQSSRRKQNTENVPEVNIARNYEPSQTSGSLFTDPKLFSLIKNDLEEIKMRRSIGQLAKFQKVHIEQPKKIETDSFNVPAYTFTQESISSSSSQFTPLTQTDSWFKDSHKIVSNSVSSKIEYENKTNQFKPIEIIREVSQQYREDEEQKKQRKSLSNKPSMKDFIAEVQQKKEILHTKPENIMNDTNIGFKKKKQSTAKFQISKQNYLPPEESIRSNIPDKFLSNSEPLKLEPKNIQKTHTVDMKPLDHEKSATTIRHEDFFHQFSRSQSSQSSSRDLSNRNESDKLIQVNQKYTRGHYQGTKLNGKRHGFGTFFYGQGGKYVGNWRENKMHGKGVLYYPSQKIAYDGDWQNDQLSGYGTLYNEQVTPLRTPFDYRDWTDVQQYWVKYQGLFYQDNKQGQGKLYLVNGERLEGEFHEDKVDGEGVLYRGDGSSVRGKWRQNKLIRMF